MDEKVEWLDRASQHCQSPPSKQEELDRFLSMIHTQEPQTIQPQNKVCSEEVSSYKRWAPTPQKRTVEPSKQCDALQNSASISHLLNNLVNLKPGSRTLDNEQSSEENAEIDPNILEVLLSQYDNNVSEIPLTDSDLSMMLNETLDPGLECLLSQYDAVDDLP